MIYVQLFCFKRNVLILVSQEFIDFFIYSMYINLASPTQDRLDLGLFFVLIFYNKLLLNEDCVSTVLQ